MKHSYKYYLRLLWVKLMHLGKLTGCHQLPERSFHYKDYQFPVCARCCGVLIGETLAIIVIPFGIILSIPVSLTLMLGMFVDWFTQYVEIKQSNNIRRLITGIMGGLGCWSLYINIFIQLMRFFKKIRNSITS